MVSDNSLKRVVLRFSLVLNFIDFIDTINVITRLHLALQVWLLDQFGVLHDGKQPYPAAISTCMYSLLQLLTPSYVYVMYVHG